VSIVVRATRLCCSLALAAATVTGIDPDLSARDDEIRIAVQDFAVTR